MTDEKKIYPVIPADENPFVSPEEAADQNPSFEEISDEFTKQKPEEGK
jgi:hypothetical protein